MALNCYAFSVSSSTRKRCGGATAVAETEGAGSVAACVAIAFVKSSSINSRRPSASRPLFPAS